ncbi:MAG: hypothetical protein LBK47_03635 [Prevotellaceae bacterium]|jgi:hypothetical protein|nr:hypothetical protein [Prevotellaceae bacterium]
MKISVFIHAIAVVVMASCCSSAKKENVAMIKENPKVVATVVDSLKARYANIDVAHATKGVTQAAELWYEGDGDEKEFVKFCMESYVNDAVERRVLFQKLSEKFELLFGHFNQLDLGLKRSLHEVGDALGDVDYRMGEFDVTAHFNDDMFDSKLAFATIVNFPSYSLSEKQQMGEGWSRQEWGYARLGDLFTSRIPAKLRQEASAAGAAAENYIAAYNIVMGSLRNDANEALFPAGMKLISHWGLRDELKSSYADSKRGLEKQRMIYAVMKQIIAQEIPAKVIDNGERQWNPIANKVYENGKEATAEREQDIRYQMFINNFKTLKAEDPYVPLLPTYSHRAFEGSMEFSQEEVREIFTQLISSSQVKEVAKLIEKRLGRNLEPFDIWYDGFKTRSSIAEDDLSAKTVKAYPSAAAFEKDLPGILQRLGFTAAEAQRISSKIEVDAARGSGHAWGAQMKGDKAHLRTRIPANGMDYKGYNIAMHEFGHNVEQTISLYDVDYYMMNGVPNTAFTEALAFIFQKRDLEVLGMAEKNPAKNHLMALDIFWGCYEIMGVSLVDMAVWEWLYANPSTTPAQLRENVMRIARKVWNAYYAPILGEKDSPILAIYSHMINTPLYLSNYPMGHLIEFQLEEHLRGKDFASEVLRIYSMGRLAPQLWMKRATGSEVSIDPMLKAAELAVMQLK